MLGEALAEGAIDLDRSFKKETAENTMRKLLEYSMRTLGDISCDESKGNILLDTNQNYTRIIHLDSERKTTQGMNLFCIVNFNK